MEGLNSPIIQKYELVLDKNPSSRVFAPLAESYRKIGMLDKSLQTLREGIKINPDYSLGHIGLGHCYFDMGEFSLAYTILSPMLESNQDNLRLLKIYTKVCVEIGNEEEALETAKYLLFLNPRDKDAAQIVIDLEDKIESSKIQYQMALNLDSDEYKSVEIKNQNLSNSEESNDNADSWVKVDFPEHQEEITEEDDLSKWTLNKQETLLEEKLGEEVILEEKLVEPEERTFLVESKPEIVDFNLQLKSKLEPISEPKFEPKPGNIAKESNSPVITHTLVDLYCSQGHVEKAIEILEKILELNPKDIRTIEKLEEVKHLLVDSYDESNNDTISENAKVSRIEELTEENGRQNLMSYFDQKFDNEDEINSETNVSLSNESKNPIVENENTTSEIENIFWTFHKKLCERASYQLSK